MAINLNLPVSSQKAKSKNPRKLFIFAHTKCGKTKTASLLPNNLIIDLEDGSDFCDGMFLNIKQIAKENNMSVLQTLKEVTTQLKSSEQKYDYLTIDTASALEQYAEQLAVILYKKSPIGKNYQGTNVVTELPNGAGYGWLRTAFEEIYNLFEGIATKGLIILGHVKNSSINKDGKELQVKDLNLTGKLKLIVSADVDAIGIMSRNPKNSNEVMISFKTEELDIATGARPDHLKQTEFVLNEYNPETKVFTHHWDKIFLPEDSK